MENILYKTIKFYGEDSQYSQAQEELAELIVAISKVKRGFNARENLVEEIADVEIMLEQLKIMLQIEATEIDSIKDMKLLRLAKRMKKNKKLVCSKCGTKIEKDQEYSEDNIGNIFCSITCSLLYRIPGLELVKE